MQVRRFNWVNKPSAWETLQANREKNKAMAADFNDASSLVASIVADAHNNLNTGMASIAAQRLIDRSQAEIKAKADSIAAQQADLFA